MSDKEEEARQMAEQFEGMEIDEGDEEEKTVDKSNLCRLIGNNK
jgi:hypothetical protein